MDNRGMKIPYNALSAVFLSLLTFSCQDVINIDLRVATPRPVIEAVISNISDTAVVQVHKSTDYYQPSGITPVNDATVKITDNSGSVHTLTLAAPGIYKGGKLKGRPHDRFSLEIKEGTETFTSEASMPALVKIQQVILDQSPEHPGEDRLNILINDPAGEENYYMFEVFRNDEQLAGDRIILYNDKYFDGTTNFIIISGRRLGIESFSSGDRIRVRLKNIDRLMYKYFDVLNSITSGMEMVSGSSPANPPNNITGAALGYFGVWSVSEVQLTRY
jgi:hypothetical protein